MFQCCVCVDLGGLFGVELCLCVEMGGLFVLRAACILMLEAVCCVDFCLYFDLGGLCAQFSLYVDIVSGRPLINVIRCLAVI